MILPFTEEKHFEVDVNIINKRYYDIIEGHKFDFKKYYPDF